MANRWLEELGGLLDWLRSEMAGEMCVANVAGSSPTGRVSGTAGVAKSSGWGTIWSAKLANGKMRWVGGGGVVDLGDRWQCGKRQDAESVGER